eukprot:831327-Prymnesium_polylepis.1
MAREKARGYTGGRRAAHSVTPMEGDATSMLVECALFWARWRMLNEKVTSRCVKRLVDIQSVSPIKKPPH